MEIFRIKNLSFAYPKREVPAIENLSLDVERGEFLVVMGKSGSGKSTLLRNLKPALAPNGEKTGEIFFEKEEGSGLVSLEDLEPRVQASAIGYVLQNPDNQIVTDKVWHELAFGLENLGLEKNVIRMRVSEMANFFGIQSWFNKDTKELSGGQKQTLNLAAVMVMKPQVLILDEPTSQLDPIAASDFLQVIRKINREIGTTIILSEHRLDEVLPIADRAVVIEDGKIIADDKPENVGGILSKEKNNMFAAMPAPMQAYSKVYEQGYGVDLSCPIDVRGGRLWLNKILKGREVEVRNIENKYNNDNKGKVIFDLKDVWFRYAKDQKDVVKGLDLKVREGEILALVGGNGTGKTTILNILAGLRKAYRGKVKLFDKNIDKYENQELRKGLLGMLPQDPQSIFVADKVKEDLLEVLIGRGLSEEEKEAEIKKVVEITEVENLLESHPYDISGGEQQRVALAKILLLNPKVILLDEPTKGIDNFFKKKLGEVLRKLKDEGKTIIVVSHDIEFSGQYADRCAMVFEGKITTEGNANDFFSGNSFYTTSANKMSSHIFNNAITADNVAELVIENINRDDEKKKSCNKTDDEIDKSEEKLGKSLGQGKEELEAEDLEKKLKKNKLKHRALVGAVVAAMAGGIYASIQVGMATSFYLTSALMIFCMMVPFFITFERSKPKARELVLLAVIIALAVAGRAAFFMVPQVKPILAVVIAGSYCLGPNSGFIVGAMSAFVSNFLFGQGPWTPWQMIAMGILGMLAGLIGKRARKSNSEKRAGKEAVKVSMWFAVAGGIGTFLIYGLFVDIWTIFGFGSVTLESILLIYMAAIPFNGVFAISTAIFLLLFANPIINKIERIKLKYGFELDR